MKSDAAENTDAALEASSTELADREVVGSGDRMLRVALPRVAVLLLTLVAIAASLVLHQSGMTGYVCSWDDFPLIDDGLSWERTRESLWRPFHNHLFPLFRLMTWALVGVADRLSAIPNNLFIGWLVGLAVTLLVLFEFVHRETGCGAAGLVAVLSGGVNSAYHLSAGQYATSQIFWALSFLLAMLLMLQSMRGGFRWRAWIGAMVLAFLAPAWRTEGLLAGPVGCLYAALFGASGLGRRDRTWMAVGPLIGCGLYLGLALVIGGRDLIAAPAHVGGASLVAFDPLRGATLTVRMGTEHLLVWNLGMRCELPLEQCIALFGVLTVLVAYWLRRAQFSALALCGLALTILSYMFVFTIRGNLGLEGARRSPWYLIFPQFGWTLFVCAGIRSGVGEHERAATRGDVARVALLGLALYLMHHTVVARLREPGLCASQQREFRQLQLIDELCRREGIDAATVREAIGPFVMTGSARFDGLRLITAIRTVPVADAEAVRRRVQEILFDGTCDATPSAP